jgi:4'-phosphopantetheinyl transferase
MTPSRASCVARVSETNTFLLDGEGAVHVWRADLACGDAELARLEAFLDEAELARARRFHFERDRRNFTAARGILRELLGRYLGCPPASIRFRQGPHGKPALDQAALDLEFNLSHSNGRALFAFSIGREVGVDLEAGARLGDDWPGLGRRIFSAREQEELARQPIPSRRDAFLNGWTRKEAYLKATGQGLVNGLKEIEVRLDLALSAAFLSEDIAARWTLIDLRAASGWASALVVAGAGAQFCFNDWNAASALINP